MKAIKTIEATRNAYEQKREIDDVEIRKTADQICRLAAKFTPDNELQTRNDQILACVQQLVKLCADQNRHTESMRLCDHLIEDIKN